MPELVWDRVGDRVFETGLDKGVLYLPDGSAVPWNGLTSVIEHFQRELVPVYFDGMKISDLVVLGDFSATMRAVTYPEEFAEIEGMASNKSGLFYTEQPPQLFGLCYRTQVGNDVEGAEAGYKLHIIYNLVAIPTDKTYATVSNDPSLVEFEWEISAVPEEVPGFRPTAQIIIDSRDFDGWLLQKLEEMFYGTQAVNAALIPMPDLITYINEWARIKIIDNGDGTWTAITAREGMIEYDYDGWGSFRILGANAIFLTDDTFEISDATDASSVPQIKIYNNGDGTWTAETDQDGLIVMTGPDSFEIRNANVIWLADDHYQISDTQDETE